MTLGERLKKYLQDNKMSLNALATKVLKMNYKATEAIVNGDIYSAKVAKKIADSLGPEFEQYIVPNRCQYCGKEFIGKLGVKYCSPICNSKYYYCVRDNRPLPRFQRTEGDENIKSLPELEAEARENNMTYGQRVAMQRLAESR